MPLPPCCPASLLHCSANQIVTVMTWSSAASLAERVLLQPAIPIMLPGHSHRCCQCAPSTSPLACSCKNHHRCISCAAHLHQSAIAPALSNQPAATACTWSCPQLPRPKPGNLQLLQDFTHDHGSLFPTDRRNTQPASVWKLHPARHRSYANAPQFAARMLHLLS